LRIRGGIRKLGANGRTLFANGVRRSVMLFEWLSPSMGLTTFLTMTRFGVSNGSVALATTRACRATPESPVCLTQLPPGETNPLSARARSWQTKTTAKISVGLLPYISIVSVWQRRRPVVTNLGACHHRLCIDTTATRDTVPKAKRALFSDIPSSGIFRVVDSYRFPEPMKSRAWSC
jgi:hypothetical protein